MTFTLTDYLQDLGMRARDIILQLHSRERQRRALAEARSNGWPFSCSRSFTSTERNFVDPKETLRLIREDGCVQALQDLAEWLAKGGFPPEFESDPLPFIEDFRESGHFELACAVRVALLYGDRSGLEGLGYRVIR